METLTDEGTSGREETEGKESQEKNNKELVNFDVLWFLVRQSMLEMANKKGPIARPRSKYCLMRICRWEVEAEGEDEHVKYRR